VKSLLRRVPGLTRAVQSLRGWRFRTTRLWRRRRIRAYLRAHEVHKLQLGTGSNLLDGWLNTDIYDETRTRRVVYLDARKRFPFEDASFDYVFTEHMIEHLDYANSRRCLRECLRVLKPGGQIRLATPSLQRIADLYHGEGDVQLNYVRWSIDTFIPDADAYLPGFVVNNFARDWGHRFVFDGQTLRQALETAGFVEIGERAVGESATAHLAGLEHHGKMIPPEFNEYETLVLEARRP
jgi:predicted SAM-dependent methyltransferase